MCSHTHTVININVDDNHLEVCDTCFNLSENVVVWVVGLLLLLICHHGGPPLLTSSPFFCCVSSLLFTSFFLLIPITLSSHLYKDSTAIATWFPLLSPPIFLLHAQLRTMQKPPLLSLLCTAAPSAVMAFASRAFPSVISSSLLHQHHGTYGCQGHIIKTR